MACLVDGCANPIKYPNRGLCKPHYMEWWRAERAPMIERREVPPCSVEGCEKQAKSVRLCAMHYRRLREEGDVGEAERRAPGRPSAGAEAVFWRRVIVQDGCWGWRTRSSNKEYYGTIKAEGRSILAHRFSYELHHGPIPEGFDVLHSCDNPPCCNPQHLSVGTHADNMRDMAVRHRAGGRKLTLDQVRQVRQWISEGVNDCEIARRIGTVHSHAICDIRHGNTWRHVA